MIFDGKIFKISGASDYEDSAMFNGLIALFEYDSRVNFGHFIFGPPNKYIRHPYRTKYNFSRDQYLCLIAGIYKQNIPYWINENWIDGNDFLSPSDHAHTRRCQDLQATKFQDAWFWAELWFSAKFKPMDELNQLFAKMMVADKKFMKWYCKTNPKWSDSLRAYWCGWRQEKDFCEHMISKIEELIK